tara:strand:+ start:843 stop:1403 length:561 start_codon:yes stop_codon:yes gene_type:complete
MVIHKTHTKKDLVEIIDVFEFGEAIDNYRELNKDTLSALLDIHLRTISLIHPRKQYYACDDLDDLREYLKNSSPKQVLTIKEKDLIIDKAKKIIFFCNIAGYCIGSTTYSTMDEVLEDANDIRRYGDIPTIRRAIKLLNQCSFINGKIECIITYRCQQRIDRKHRIKKNGLARMTLATGHFELSFD